MLLPHPLFGQVTLMQALLLSFSTYFLQEDFFQFEVMVYVPLHQYLSSDFTYYMAPYYPIQKVYSTAT
jgi:hypothetical protein